MDMFAAFGIIVAALAVALLVNKAALSRYLDQDAERAYQIRAERAKRERKREREDSRPPIVELAAKVGSKLPLARGAETEYRKALARAGIRLDATTWRGLELLVLASFAALGVMLGISFGGEGAVVAMPLGGLALGLAAPKLVLKAKERDRVAQVDADLPDILDLLSINVQAGSTLERGFKQIAQKCSGPLAEEFDQVDKDINLFNIPSVEALERMTDRCRSRQLGLFCSAITQSITQGASIGPALRAQALQARQTQFDALEEKANKLSVKAVVPMALFFLPATLIMGASPFVASVFTTFSEISSGI